MKASLVTWVTHNSRVSERMIKYKVKRGEGVWMDMNSEEIVTKAIAKIIQKGDLKVLAYNICGDHVHVVLVCDEDRVSKIIQKIKSISARKHNIKLGITNVRYNRIKHGLPAHREINPVIKNMISEYSDALFSK